MEYVIDFFAKMETLLGVFWIREFGERYLWNI